MKSLLLLVATALPLTAGAMDISAKSAIIIDEKSGKVLWSKDADTKRYPASTTKIMTSLLLLERALPSDMIIAPAEIETVRESSMHLKPFEMVSAKDMLYAMMLRSANDGCYAVAKHISGSVQEFSRLMNERAKQIGCTNTNFNNPNGLNDDRHWTTARDLALIAREAMKYEPFRQVVKTQKYTIKRSINQKDTQMVNRNKWLFKDQSADGIKTGYTRPAGLCYVGSATRNGFRVITVVLKSENWQKDHQQMLNWAYKYYEKKPEISPGEVVGAMAVQGGSHASIPVAAQAAVTAVARKDAPLDIQFEPTVPLVAPIEKGTVLGEAVIRDREGFEQRVPIVAAASVSAAPMAALASSIGGNGFGIVMGSLLFAGVYFMRSRARKFGYGTSTTPKSA